MNMNMNTEDLLVRLRALKPEIRSRYKAKEIELFGSFAQGKQKENSDIDILANFEEGADLFDLIGLALFLEEEFRQKVDVVPKRALRTELRESVLKEAVPI